MRSKEDDLVLGMASGIDDISLTVFVRSLRHYNKYCRIVLFVNESNWRSRSPRAKTLFKQYHVSVFSASEVLKKFNNKLRNFHPSTNRWPIMYDFLREPKDYETIAGPSLTINPTSVSKVLLADTRDTAFEGDPFDMVKQRALYVFGEDVLISSCGWNSG